MTKNILLVFFVLISQGCNFSINKSNEINIYSQRHYDSDKMQYKKFEEKTGIKVNVTKAGADELIQRLKNVLRKILLVYHFSLFPLNNFFHLF